MSFTASPSLNRILESLPAEDFQRLSPLLRPRLLQKNEVLLWSGEPIDHVYFPRSGICSTVLTMRADGRVLNVGLVGREGIVGYLAGLGAVTSSSDVIGKVPPVICDSLPRAAFVEELKRGGALARLFEEYVITQHTLAESAAVCHAVHGTQERAARWLLVVADRMGPHFNLTHEDLATMMGVYRPTATLVAGSLQQAGLISYRRAKMEIVNRAGLEEAACECYGTMKQLQPALRALNRTDISVQDARPHVHG